MRANVKTTMTIFGYLPIFSSPAGLNETRPIGGYRVLAAYGVTARCKYICAHRDGREAIRTTSSSPRFSYDLTRSSVLVSSGFGDA